MGCCFSRSDDNADPASPLPPPHPLPVTKRKAVQHRVNPLQQYHGAYTFEDAIAGRWAAPGEQLPRRPDAACKPVRMTPVVIVPEAKTVIKVYKVGDSGKKPSKPESGPAVVDCYGLEVNISSSSTELRLPSSPSPQDPAPPPPFPTALPPARAPTPAPAAPVLPERPCLQAVLENHRRAMPSSTSWDITPVLTHPHPPSLLTTIIMKEHILKNSFRDLQAEHGSLDSFYEQAVPKRLAECSNTCSGAGKNTGRGEKSRANLKRALRVAREGVRRDDKLVNLYMDVNKEVYNGVMEAIPSQHMGRSRSECNLKVKVGKVCVFPPEEVDAAMAAIENYYLKTKEAVLQGEALGIDLVARLFMSLISVHPCPDGNGRTASCIVTAVAETLSLPPPLLTKESCKILRAYENQQHPSQNSTPSDCLHIMSTAMADALMTLSDHLDEVIET
eukprot:TRINITY_DN12169_c0_g1_i1.p1 TRINITY_DN12169_c0_g1~~TRINITY_DN12169_c0_g1_i1.p1  ORF type:complete len:446 (+),score=76.17 TRINITY_DN12169_c0_g1_i1:908-2245(+)